MTASAFVVTLDPTSIVPVRNGVAAAVVYANDDTEAKELLKALFAGDCDAAWDNATYTAMVAGVDLDGWSLRCQVIDTDGTVTVDETVVGTSTDNTIDEIGALMVTALNATTPIANASYASNVLTVAAIADGLGDQRLIVEFWPSVGDAGQKVSIPGFVGTIVQSGIAGAALTVDFAADAYTVPSVAAQFADRE